MSNISHGVAHFNVDDEADLIELINNGAIWHGTSDMQQDAVQAILDGKAQLNDRVPPGIADWIQGQLDTGASAGQQG